MPSITLSSLVLSAAITAEPGAAEPPQFRPLPPMIEQWPIYAGPPPIGADLEVTRLVDRQPPATGPADAPKGYRPNIDPRHVRFGLVTSQADFGRDDINRGAMNAAAARARYNITGRGVRIGVISDSYNVDGNAVDGVRSGDLPGLGNPDGFDTRVGVLKDAASGIDEGRAMIELIHDLAPNAEIFFHSGFNNPGTTDASIAFAVDALRDVGCDIICDDLANLTQAYFQDGHVADSYSQAYALGVSGFSSAGNSADEAWEGQYNQLTSPNTPGGDPVAHNWDIDGSGPNPTLDVFVPSGGTARMVLHWDDPYPSVGAPFGAEVSDFDAYVYFEDQLISFSTSDQGSGDDPYEFFGVSNGGPDGVIQIVVVPFGPVNPDARISFRVFDSGIIFDNDDTNSSTIFGGAAGPDTMACGAVRYDTGQLELFSSIGDRTMAYNHDGDRIDEFRPKPDISATNGTNTTFFGSDYEGDGFPNFFGTSAASPHAAAAAALALSYARTQLGTDIEVEILLQLIEETAAPLAEGSLGGAGLIDCLALLDRVDELYNILPCFADMTTTHANPGVIEYGLPDGTVDGADLAFYVERWLIRDPERADLTFFGTNPGDPFYGQPDGSIDGADLAYFVEGWLSQCN